MLINVVKVAIFTESILVLVNTNWKSFIFLRQAEA